MEVVNLYFKKGEEHRVMYKSGGRCNLMEIGDCKVMSGENVAG